MLSEIFLLPVREKWLLHAPLHGISAVLNPAGAAALKSALHDPLQPLPPAYEKLAALIKAGVEAPKPRQGGLQTPQFLGLLPTRNCNMRCVYCDFPASGDDRRAVMSKALGREAIDAYFNLLKESGASKAAIHYFGGEPFFAPEVVFFTAEYARQRARELDLALHLEASSNGFVEASMADWIAATFNCIVLSLDGPQAVQNRQRPAGGRQGSYQRVVATAKKLSASPCSLILRACITQESLPNMVQTAAWMGEAFNPEAVCLEPMTESDQAKRAGLHPPNPWDFSKEFLKAQMILDGYGVNCVLSTADLSLTTVSSCPVGHDALIVSPRGEVDACYLLPESWRRKGKEMHLGALQAGAFAIPQENLNRVRSYHLGNKPLCKDCFCRYHCAGGCHVNHPADRPPGAYDDICIRTRLVTAGKLLRRTGQAALLAQWLDDNAALKETALRQSDRIEALP